MDKPLGDYTYSPSFLSIPSPQPTPSGGCDWGIRKDYYVFMTALVDLEQATEKSYSFSNLDTPI